MGSRPIFGKALKFPIHPYFCRLDRIILCRLKKIKKNIEKSKIIFFGSWFRYRWEVGPFSERLKFPIYPYFFSVDGIILSRLKKNKEKNFTVPALWCNDSRRKAYRSMISTVDVAQWAGTANFVTKPRLHAKCA